MSHPRIASTVAMLALAACSGSNQASPTPQPNEPIVSQRDIGPIVSRTVCELQNRCGQIGPGEVHQSVAACITDTSNDVADEVDAEDCQDGAPIPQLNACLVQIQNKGCPGDVEVGDLASCNEDLMCFQPGGEDATPLVDPEMRGRTRRSR